MPDKSYYMPETMGVEDIKKFEKWHAEQVKNNAVFNMRRDIKNYCSMDVTILREGCQTFQKLFMKETEIVDPETGKVTSRLQSVWPCNNSQCLQQGHDQPDPRRNHCQRTSLRLGRVEGKPIQTSTGMACSGWNTKNGKSTPPNKKNRMTSWKYLMQNVLLHPAFSQRRREKNSIRRTSRWLLRCYKHHLRV